MKNITENGRKILEILNSMSRYEAWDMVEHMLILLVVKDVKEENYDAFLNSLKETVLESSKGFKKFMDKQEPHGNS